jgi:hypothetical protein
VHGGIQVHLAALQDVGVAQRQQRCTISSGFADEQRCSSIEEFKGERVPSRGSGFLKHTVSWEQSAANASLFAKAHGLVSTA